VIPPRMKRRRTLRWRDRPINLDYPLHLPPSHLLPTETADERPSDKIRMLDERPQRLRLPIWATTDEWMGLAWM
jgi:hypothetical protein